MGCLKKEFEKLRQAQKEWNKEKEAVSGSYTEGTIATSQALISDWEYTEVRVYYLINNYMS